MSIATGMNFFDGQQWRPSDPSFQIGANGAGFLATNVQHPVFIASNLDTQPAVIQRMADGVILRSTPLAIALLDPVSGGTSVIGEITNCAGELIDTNTVLFENAFSGVCASVVFRLERGSFRQDVVLTGDLDPTAYGFSTNARIQVITEFYEPPSPEVTTLPLRIEMNQSVRNSMAVPDLIDQTLSFGQAVFGPGRAYLSPTPTGAKTAPPVVKELTQTSDGRWLLVESLEYASAWQALQTLPPCNSGAPSADAGHNLKRAGAGYAALPLPPASRAPANPFNTASVTASQPTNAFQLKPPAGRLASLKAPTGLSIDYLENIGGSSGETTNGPTVFESDVDYFIDGPYYCDGPVTIEGGTVFKYPTASTPAFIQLNGTLTVATAGYWPAIFTAGDDCSVGSSLSTAVWQNFTGIISPQGYACPALELGYSVAVPITEMRFCYAAQAILADCAWGRSLTFAHLQFLDCIQGIALAGSGAQIAANNCLFYGVGTPLEENATGGASETWNLLNCTLNQVTNRVIDPYNSSTTLTCTNCVFASVSNLYSVYNPATVKGRYNGFDSSIAPFGNNEIVWSYPIFQSAGSGNCYLSNGCAFHGAGTASLSIPFLESLWTKSTYAPTELLLLVWTNTMTLSRQVPRYGHGAPDLGFYYDSLDYILEGVEVSDRGRVVVTPGTGLAVRNALVGSDENGDLFYTYPGFDLEQGSTFVSHGTPTSPITYTSTKLVQEQADTPAGLITADIETTTPDFDASSTFYPCSPPIATFRFCNFYCLGDDYDFASGAFNPGSSPNSAVYLGLQDCAVFGGNICFGAPQGWVPTYAAPGSIWWDDNALQRVQFTLAPNDWRYGYLDCDLAFSAYNNWFYGGTVLLLPSPSSSGNWFFRDNLFDSVAFYQEPSWPPEADYNAYWPLPAADFAILDAEDLGPWTNSIYSDLGTPDQYSPHDVVLTAAPGYQGSMFGNAYLPTNCPTFNAGSRSSAQAGLYQYTTRTNQTKEGAEAAGHRVNIGPHYVAASTSSGYPISSYIANVYDYVADANGDGIVDATNTAPPPNPLTPVTLANNDFFQVTENTKTNQLNVLLNDFDSQGFPLTIFYPSATNTTVHNGSVFPATNFQSVIYTPRAGYYGVDTFTYAIVNDFNRESSATVNVFVCKTNNHAPVAVNHIITLSSSQTSVTTNLLAGCSDPDNDTLSVYAIGAPQLGAIQNQGGGTIVYTRNASVAGNDVFFYTITDGKGGLGMATVQISRNTGSDQAPVGISYSTTATMNRPVNLAMLAYSPVGNPLSYSIVQGPQYGSLNQSPPNGSNFTYTATNGYIGPDFFTFAASDGTLSSLAAGISILVQHSNTVPIANSMSVYDVLNTPVPIYLSGVDYDGDVLLYSIVAGPTNGTLAATATNTLFIYTPNPDYEGPDAFSYTASNGEATSAPAGVALTISRLQIATLTGPQTNYVFKRNMTTLVTNQVVLAGETTFEGGSVVKFASNCAAKLILTGTINDAASLYEPVILTALDDDSVGTLIPGSSGLPQNYYAAVALEMPTNSGTQLEFFHISYASVALHYPSNITTAISDSLRHVQIGCCGQALLVEGNAAHQRQVTLENCLLWNNAEVFAGSAWSGIGQNLTVDSPNYLLDTNASCDLFLTNSVFSYVSALGGSSTTNISGDTNGFDVNCTYANTTFGVTQIIDNGSESPYAPPFDSDSGFLSVENGQGWYYLREGSPFIGAGTTNIDSALLNDFAQMTTTVPQLFADDVNFSETLSPVIPRDTGGPPCLGYHYPVVDYAINGATVNNATLNIDQGVVLGFTDPFYYYEWGLRLNPGGRLNVNGVPTNRVVFAHLEAVQECPLSPVLNGPLITFKGVFLPDGMMVTPLPEAHFHYADFPALAGPMVAFGPLSGDVTYDCITNLELDGCHFQNGTFFYEAGGPQGRTVSVHNTVFERSFIQIDDLWQAHGNNEEILTAWNNLFYNCDMWLAPVSGANWLFIDNIFDNAGLHGNGPAVNTHNAYINMTNRLAPSAPTSTDPNLASLNYASGPLGAFYLPSDGTAALLSGTGSRTAGAAALYHFTSFTSNVKEATGQVNIGPAYLALCNGVPCDSNGDGIPDFIADRNGNGVEDQNEIPWTSANTGGLAILSPLNGATVSGIIQLRVNFGLDSHSFGFVSALVDGTPVFQSGAVSDPAVSYGLVEIDTRFIANGNNHTLSVQGYDGTPSGASLDGLVVESQPIPLNVNNPTSFVGWQDRSDLAVNVNVQTSAGSAAYTFSFFDSSYPKSYSPTPLNSYSGTSANGNINYFETPSNLGYSDVATDPAVYSAIEIAGGGSGGGQGQSVSAEIDPNSVRSSYYPGVGLWATAYADDPVDFYQTKNQPMLDWLMNPQDPSTRWWHDIMFTLCWYACGVEATDNDYNSVVAFPTPGGTTGQTWPLRTQDGNPKLYADQRTLKQILAQGTDVCNFYGFAHGNKAQFMGLVASDYQRYIGNKRFRFAFFDGCLTGGSADLFRAFGATPLEQSTAMSFYELDASEGFPEVLTGPLTISDYETATVQNPEGLGTRPGLFLGWRYTLYNGHQLKPQQQDPTTFLWCSWDKYPALANWESTLMLYWRNGFPGFDFLSAFDEATTLAGSPESTPPWDIMTPAAILPDGTQVQFLPWYCMVIAGAGNMGFNEFNHAGDQW